MNDETPQSEDEFDFAPPIEAVEAECGCASEDELGHFEDNGDDEGDA